MIIRAMRHGDTEAVAEIEQLCFHAPWSAKSLAEELEHSDYIFLVAEEENRVLGYVGCQTVLDEGYITNVAVHPDGRRHGLAKALLAALREAALRRGLSFVTLEVRESNAPAIILYDRAGYVPVGVRRGFYSNPKEDARLMTLYLTKDGYIDENSGN